MNSKQLKNMAGVVWVLIGLMLLWRSIPMLQKAYESGSSIMVLGISSAIGLLFGAAKGKFVLSKSAKRNILRIDNLAEPLKPWQIFPVYLYPLVLVMIGMGKGTRYLAETGSLPGGWTTASAVYLGIGAALTVSSFNYFQKKNPST